MEFILLAALLGLLPAYIAMNKGKSFALWWLYGVLLFIVALPHALLMKSDVATLERQALSSGMKKCPHCAELIKQEAKVCRFCSRDLVE